jgi:hypothetical protein
MTGNIGSNGSWFRYREVSRLAMQGLTAIGLLEQFLLGVPVTIWPAHRFMLLR